MHILVKSSLAQTIDRVNHCDFLGIAIQAESSREAIAWIAKSLNNELSYAGSFGLSERDAQEQLYTFTGEPLRSPASLRHIHAEEASRALLVLNRTAQLPAIPELEQSNAALLSCLQRSEQQGKPQGTYCCGPCTVSLWRHLAAGGLESYAGKMEAGLAVLKAQELPDGEWRRFPFYYTLLALNEVNPELAKPYVQHALGNCERKLKSVRINSRFGERRLALLRRTLEKFS